MSQGLICTKGVHLGLGKVAFINRRVPSRQGYRLEGFHWIYIGISNIFHTLPYFYTYNGTSDTLS